MNQGNPYRTALLAISLVSAFVGLISIMAGASMAGGGSYEGIGVGAGLFAFGASLLPLSGICFLLWLVVSAIGWRPGPASAQPERPSRPMLIDENEEWTEENSL
jgi:hypothetical protein